MARKDESVLRAKVRKLLEKIPNLFFEPIQQASISGTPDFLVCARGLFFGLELKASHGVASEIQKYKFSKIGKAGGRHFVVNPSNYQQVCQWLYDFCEGALDDDIERKITETKLAKKIKEEAATPLSQPHP